jgi:hypothetical protein
MKILTYLTFVFFTTSLLAQSQTDFDIVTYTYTDASGAEKTGTLKKYKKADGTFTGEEEEYYGMTAEEWLTYKGYTSLRLLSLLDMEAKLEATNKTSAKMQSTRGWINTLLAEYIASPQAKLSWPEPVYSYNETMQEALQALSE